MLSRLATRLTLLIYVFVMQTPAFAQWLGTPQPGDIFKEFSRTISHSNNNWRVTDPNTPRADAQAFLPNHTLSLSINDLSGATRAEVVAEVWGGHVGTINKRFRFNNNAWITFPEMGAANGIPSGTNGECYTQQLNYTVPIPLSHLIQGTNSFTGTPGGQTCFNFNWGQWGWYQIMVRVYYGPSKPHTTGSITSPSNGGTIGENPTVTASLNGSASQVDFLAYYYGYDTDGDGIFTQYHHSYNRTKSETQMIMKNHMGNRTSSPWQVTWNTNLVPDQAAGSVRLIARVRDNNGTSLHRRPNLLLSRLRKINYLAYFFLFTSGTCLCIFMPVSVAYCIFTWQHSPPSGEVHSAQSLVPVLSSSDGDG